MDRDSTDKREYCRLVWIGGVSQTSNSQYFGGYSGLAINSSGTQIISVSDSGSWLSADLNVNSDGRIIGLNQVRIGPLQAKNGRHFDKKSDMDAEEVTLADGGFRRGTVYVSFEIYNRVAKYSI